LGRQNHQTNDPYIGTPTVGTAGNHEVTPQAMWTIKKSLMKREGPKAPTAVHDPLGTTNHSKQKANKILDCRESQLRAVETQLVTKADTAV
jgi:hypothetical protein